MFTEQLCNHGPLIIAASIVNIILGFLVMRLYIWWRFTRKGKSCHKKSPKTN